MLGQSCHADGLVKLLAIVRDADNDLDTRSVGARVRCNLIVAMGDLAVRFPNVLEPWTSHMYQPLSDADLGMILTACRLSLLNLDDRPSRDTSLALQGPASITCIHLGSFNYSTTKVRSIFLSCSERPGFAAKPWRTWNALSLVGKALRNLFRPDATAECLLLLLAAAKEAAGL